MKMIKIWAFVIPVILFLGSCKRDYTEKGSGTNQIMASQNFAVTSPFTATPGEAFFDIGICQDFSATFNETVSWKIILTGNTSHGKKTLTGTSSSLNPSNSTWCGTHDETYFFETGERVTAELVVSGRKTDKPDTISFVIQTELAYNSWSSPADMFSLIKGGSFETPAPIGFPTQFAIPNNSYVTMLLQNDSVWAPHAKRVARIHGTSIENNGFFVGGLQHRGTPGTATAFFPPTWTDPNKIYVNIYVRGTDKLPLGYKPYATVNFEFDENEDGFTHTGTLPATLHGCPYASGDGFCPPYEDGWVFKIPITHQGWKLFSCRYSDLIPSEDGKNGGFGNRILEPQKVCRVQIGLNSSPPFNLVQTDVDFACVTYGAPFDPKK